MQTGPVQDAKARFSEFLGGCLSEGPQMVTKRGAEVAVPVQERHRLQLVAGPLSHALLLSELARADLTAPPRGQTKRHQVLPLG